MDTRLVEIEIHEQLGAVAELAILSGMSLSQKVPAAAFGFLGAFPRALLTGWRAWAFWMFSIVVTIPLNLRPFWLPVYAGASGPAVPVWLLMPGWTLGACFLAATLVLLIRNYRRIEDRNERRRLRILVAGLGIAVFATAVVVVLTMPLGPHPAIPSGVLGGILSQLRDAPVVCFCAHLHRLRDPAP
ncbi:MAG: hypothetical protein EHM61_13235 [Acidobacteria bacterium]|nr:MAG: hypothetical protein EHM61_13235 [Acidobacteriota bacterium]